MQHWRWLFFFLFVASISLNVYFLYSTAHQTSPIQALSQQNQAEFASIASDLKTLSQSEHHKSSKQHMSNPQPAMESRDKLLAQATHWLVDKKFVALEVFLQKYLKQHPQDMDFLLVEAELKVQTSLLSDAITHYYDLLRMPMTASQKDQIDKEIKHLTSSTIDQLTASYSWDILARFVEPLLQLEPNNRYYILSLARAYAELWQGGLMENVLASLAFEDPSAQDIRQIVVVQQQNRDGEKNDSSSDAQGPTLGQPISLEQVGHHYLVNGSLSSNPVTLLIDTGASVTAISREYFNNLSNRYKVNYMGRFSIGTAAGTVMARMYQFDELKIQHRTVKNLAVVVMPMHKMEDADGLLGMNFLREFDFKIDQVKSLMYLTPFP